MGHKFNDSELFENQEIHIEHEGQTYIWWGDYEIRTWGELPSWDYPGDSESEVVILKTDSFDMYIEETDSFEAVKLTREFKQIIEEAIKQL